MMRWLQGRRWEGFGFSRSSNQAHRRPLSVRLSVEPLEDRFLLTANPLLAQPGVLPDFSRREAEIENGPVGPHSVIFMGDSILDFFADGEGTEIWDNQFASACADFAISGNTTHQVLWQIAQGDLSGLDPGVVVLMVGTNNLLQGETPQDTAAGIAACVGAIHAAAPNADILLLGILPRGQSPLDPARAEIAETNRLIAALDNGSTIRYEDLGGLFVQKDGTISGRAMYDYIHPTAAGYSLLAQSLVPTLNAMLADQTPPLTRDPFALAPTRFGWRPVVGDWDGDGVPDIGVVDPSGTWYLRLGSGLRETFTFGSPGMIPVVGDWLGTGHSGIGMFDPNTGLWYLRNTASAGPPNFVIPFGLPGMLPVVGDWTGSGHTRLGVFDPTTATWILFNDSGGDSPYLVFQFGKPGWLPVVGDWTGAGFTSVGVVDPSTMSWFLRASTSPQQATVFPPFQYGIPGRSAVVVGDWDRNGTTTVGVMDLFGYWYLRNGLGGGPADVFPFPDGLGPADPAGV